MTKESTELFDRMFALRDDPNAFEKERARIIENALSEFPEEDQARMRGFQWTIDQERSKYKDPIACYNRLVAMYTVSLLKLNNALHGKLELPQVVEPATILEFKRQNT